MKFVLLGARVPLDIASVGCNCKGNPVNSRSHREHPVCPPLLSPRMCRTEPLQRNDPKFLLPGTQEVTASVTPTGTTKEPKPLRQGAVPCPQRGVSVSVSNPSLSPSPGFLWSLWHMWQAGAVRPWILEHSSIPPVSLERCHHEKNLNKTIFSVLLTFCCALSWV